MDQVRKFLKKFYSGVGNQRATVALKLLERDDWQALQAMSVESPSYYSNARDYFNDVLVCDIVRKLRLPGDEKAREAMALQNFWEAEAQCAKTNIRLAPYIGNYGLTPADEGVMRFITLWRKNVRKLLGHASYVLDPAFSKGSTLSDSGKLTTIPDKMSSQPTAYRRAEVYEALYKRTPMWGEPTYNPSNKFFTVPKDSKTHRGCCMEASWALGGQLAIGKKLKQLYAKRYKVDLRHAKPLHHRLAMEGSVSGKYATIDLSNASDTVAYNLVKLILPRDWLLLLNSLRASSTVLPDGRTVWLQKYSSMGNGFTFELETIIFRTLAETLGIRDCLVFGDDIIVPSERSKDMIAALRWAGFTPNMKKTFCEGPFRESCGGDFFKGQLVRPVYLKEIPDEPSHWVSLANRIRTVDPTLSRLAAAWWYCVDQVPKDWRLFGPAWLGDTVFYDPDAEPEVRPMRVTTRYNYRRDPSTGKWLFDLDKSVTMVPQWRYKRPISRSFPLGEYWKPEVALAAAAMGVGSQVTPRDSVTGYRTASILAYGVSSTGLD